MDVVEKGRKRYRWEISSLQQQEVNVPRNIDEECHTLNHIDHDAPKKRFRWEKRKPCDPELEVSNPRVSQSEDDNSKDHAEISTRSTHDDVVCNDYNISTEDPNVIHYEENEENRQDVEDGNHSDSSNGSHDSEKSSLDLVSKLCEDLSSTSSSTYQACSGSCQKDEKHMEYERLSTLIYTAEHSNISQRLMEVLIKLPPINSRFPYRTLIASAIRQSCMEKSHIPMCPNGHAARSGKLRASQKCPVCRFEWSRSHERFWFMKPSSALRGLCNSPRSLNALREGCVKAKKAVCDDIEQTPIQDYYNGNMFLRTHGDMLQEWKDDGYEIIVFLSLSTDGFECARNRKGEPQSSWPIVCSVLNFSPEVRSKASNSIVLAVIPPSHHIDYFDTFLSEIVLDLKKLEKGVLVSCQDGRMRRIRAFVVYFTADWPAASKVLGYVGHTGRLFCRFCLKKRIFVREYKCLCAVPDVERKILKSVISRKRSYVSGQLIEAECGKRRTKNNVLSTWRSLGDSKTSERERNRIIRSTGIKRASCLKSLSFDHIYSFPYDVMHMLLLGWVKHILRLLTGTHSQHMRLRTAPKYCIPKDTLRKINEAIEISSEGIPSSWGRSPLSLENLSKFKAEDLKRHAELYFLPFLHKFRSDEKVLHLWKRTSDMITISFGYNLSLCTNNQSAQLQR